MKRLIEDELIAWKHNADRKPLLINGIRQVGKTWIVKEFGRNHFFDVIYLNFDLEPHLADVFEKSKDPKKILLELSIYFEKAIQTKETLLFFDEIQSCNAALNALKYFEEAEEPYYVIGAGSYLGITLAKGESFPVGKVDIIELMPMTFIEFLMAQRQDEMVSYINAIQKVEIISQPVFLKMMDFFREYYIVGGMPEAVKTWIKQKDVVALEKVQNNILNAYYRDFSKYPPTQLIPRLLGIWNAVVGQLSKVNRKFKYSEIDKGARAREYESAMDWLLAGGYLQKVKKVEKPELPLASYVNESHFKIYMPDVGLLRMKAEYPASAFSILSDDINIPFKGALAENVVFQELRYAHQGSLYYWSNDRYEVDFVLQEGMQVYPVEVKYGENVKSISLANLLEKYPQMIGIRYSMKNLSYDGRILNIPLPLAGVTFNIIRNFH